jgi:acetoin utilization protein AcuB
MKSIPPIKSVMTAFPHWVDAREPARRAQSLMDEHDVRHVPVVEGDRPVGILTAAEIDERAADRPAGEVCDRNVYIVDRFEPLDRVLENMADRRYASALIVKEGKLVGIFTITDACRSFGKLLRTLFPRGDGNAA